jgi:calcium-translocating P-type ATPase
MNTSTAEQLDIRGLAVRSPLERVEMLGSSPDGLRSEDVLSQRLRYGSNEPLREQERHMFLRFAANFTHTLALLLWFAAGLAFAAGIFELALAIVAVIVVNGVFAFIQEYRAEQVVAALVQSVAVRVVAKRDGTERTILASELVPGDIVRLARGDIVAADCVVIAADGLSLDLSSVTGESIPIERTADAVTKETAARARIHDLPCVAPASAVVVTGSAEAVVAATGPASTLGQIATMVEAVKQQSSVLERQVDALSRFTAAAAVLAGAATLTIAGLSTNVDFIVALTFATGVIVALVPEGLLPTLSVSLAIGGQRMAERGAAIRRLSAVESVGSVTVICTDKTGTLTENVLTVAGFIRDDHDPRAHADLIRAAALCNDAYVDDSGEWRGDAIDVALARWAQAEGTDVQGIRASHPRSGGTPFDADRRYMTVACGSEDGDLEIAKGAPEAILELTRAPLSDDLRSASLESAKRGERVVMLAISNGGWRIAGVLTLEDPPRPGVPAAIAACHAAGIRVVMLTGDHPETARVIAAKVGLHADTVTIGSALDTMSDGDLLSLLQSDAVFARIDPSQKLRIAELLKRAGEIVVVTGDGINDAPALRAADVGVAMGLRGTEVAKQAADIVLADDNFATIVAAIEEGRSIKANIRRFASYVFTSNVAELVPFVLYIFLPIPLPLAVIQVLAIDLGTDLLPALALGTERPSARLMEEPPEPPTRPLLTRSLVLKTFLFFGLIEAAMGVGGFFMFYAAEGWRPFDSLDAFSEVSAQARAMTFLGIVAGQVGCLFAQRDGPLRARLSLTSNRWMLIGLATEMAVLFVLIYTPGLNGLFEMESVPVTWMLLLPLGAALFVALDAARRAVAGMARWGRR